MRVQVKQKQWIVVMILMLLLSLIGVASAEETPTVTITAQVQQVEQMVSGEVTISTIDPTLFHDQVKLSWHIYDEAGNDLVYENERIPVTLGDGQAATIPVEIDLSELALPPQKVTIQFDLVDEENLFWFADYPGMVLEREGITCEIQAPQVVISSSQSSTLTSKHIEAEIYIDFGETGLYREGLKFSWHIMDETGQDLRFENERIDVPAPVNGISTLPLNLRFEKDSILSGEKIFSIQLDLVDEAGGYWFSQNSSIDFQTQEFFYQYHFLTAFRDSFVNSITENPLIFVMNIIVDVIVLYGIYQYIKNKKRHGKIKNSITIKKEKKYDRSAFKGTKKLLDLFTKLVIFLLMVFYISSAILHPAEPTGESGSFSLAVVSLVESGDFLITEDDYQTAIELMPSHEWYLEPYYHDTLPTDKEGNVYPWYFGAYAVLCIPVFQFFRLLGIEVVYSFAVTNALLLSGALYLVYRNCKLNKAMRFILILFLGISPVIRYIVWQSYEVATYSFIVASMVFWFTERRKAAAFFLAVAGTMNPTCMAFGIFMILEYFFNRLKKDQWRILKFIGYCFYDWKEIFAYAVCFIPCLIPIGITYSIFSRFNMVTLTGITDYAGAPSRFLAYLFDLNIGLLPYIPLMLLLIGILAIFALKNKKWKYFFSTLGIFSTIAAFSVTSHINCGMTGISRYNAWLLAMVICIIVYAIHDRVFFPIPKKVLSGTVVVSLCWCVLTVVVVAYSPTKGQAFYWSPYAEMILNIAPQLYNPLPSTFNSRTNHIDGGYEINEPVIYEGKDGFVRKVLVPTSLGASALDDLVVEEQDQAIFEKECEKIQTEKEFCYLNFPLGTKIVYAQHYTFGDEVLFTSDSNGTKYFNQGISVVEGNFAWSDGLKSQLELNVGTVSDNIKAQFEFLYVYGGTQTLIVSSAGQELYHDVVTQENPYVSFMIPQECVVNGVLALTVEYPDAIDLTSISDGTDTRLIAFGWKQIVFQPNAQEEPYPQGNGYTIGEEIVFTNQNDGTRYFESGISAVETDFAWSDGNEGRMDLIVGEQFEDLTATFTFKSIYNSSQTLIIVSNGQELFREKITTDTEVVSFSIPKECIVDGLLRLEFFYPDAVSPLELGESSDGRVLAVGYQKIIFKPQNEWLRG